MKSYIQILGCATPDTTPSVIVHFDTRAPQRYLFNCGEGTQRVCLENKVRLPKLQNIFTTRVVWETLGGLPGMLLSMADAGIPNARILGGENLTHFLVATRSFIVRSTMSVETLEFPEDGMEFKDDNLAIKAVLLCPESLHQSIKYDNDSSSSTAEISLPQKRSHDSASLEHSEQQKSSSLEYKKKVLSLMFNQSQRQNTGQQPKKRRREEEAVFEIPSKEETITIGETAATSSSTNINSEKSLSDQRRELFSQRLPKARKSSTSVAYICKGPDYKGKFNPQAAKALGLPPGPLYARLVNGTSVTAPDGSIVHPHQVLSGARGGFIFIIVDIPSVDYIPSLIANRDLSPHQTSEEEMEPGVVIHMLGNGVLEDERYRTWMKKFGENTQHIIANEEYCPQRLIFNYAGKSQYKLSKLDPTHFRIPFYSNEPLKDFKEDDRNVDKRRFHPVPDLPQKFATSAPLLVYDMEPKPKLDATQIPPLFDLQDPQSPVIKSVNYLREYLAIAQQLREEFDTNKMPPTNIPGHDVTVTTLGTGSSAPSKYRNDVGEGTYGTLIRLFGPLSRKSYDGMMTLEECIKGLKCIFISHLHADHHLGTMRILTKWNELNKGNPDSRLSIVAPGRLLKWLDEYNDIEYFGFPRMQFIDNREILPNRRSYNNKKVENLKTDLGLKDITSVEVIHCPSAYGISLQHLNGWKLVYSGDTRPCDNLIRVGKNATLLIHEATFENDLIEDALGKRHCTTSEAVKVSERMNAQSTLFTHFSQRYPKVPVFTDAHNRIGISFDLMQFRLGEFYKLPKYVKALKVLYGEECEEAREDSAEDMLFVSK
ncbi:10121_t:CDS:10 [Ambispora gerdemannii]|uniref:ribonuclease Z n=1 Tax=Ambispora gerdemannii TaxID=144530 RepID=A0A9N8ZAS1_9GLOM|nr:10121_t:CDS:10 [Ambispora gerdemannii]